MTGEEARTFAQHWIQAWNNHELEAVLSHYTDDFEMSSPMIRQFAGAIGGTLKGKTAVRAYWRAALEKIPDLHFTLIAVAAGVDSVSLYYHSVLGKRAIETFFFNPEGKVYKASAAYH